MVKALEIDGERCNGCGVCAGACPTGAIEARSPTNAELIRSIKETIREGSVVAFACPRYLSSRGGSGAGCVRVGCLGRLDESLLVAAVAFGSKGVTLIDGACQQCQFSSGRAIGGKAVEYAETILRAMESPYAISFAPELPFAPPTKARSVDEARNLSRRDFFSFLGGRMKQSAAATVGGVLGPQEEQVKSGGQVTRSELPTLLPPKRQILLSALTLMNRPSAGAMFESATWAQFGFSGACTGCQMCAFFCPTGALSKTEVDGNPAVSFKASNCTACKICQDICYRNAVTLSPAVDVSSVLDGSTRVLPMRKTDTGAGLYPLPPQR